MDSYTPLVKKMLRDHGCYPVRSGKGDHEIWYSPTSSFNSWMAGTASSGSLAWSAALGAVRPARGGFDRTADLATHLAHPHRHPVF